ncbi:DUF5333 domain-containing protein [Pseudodonghicola flavimaris]|uniref:DUF5333 domain-containing protein n=1 Tax=Pseudodonghicola flavimaris TaxID=3050036 RepID=A0ABT7EV30_9RHOB|nr:DUF5333 domain-containing protein [Pseudodonghicola flavimaris]MDK3016197.1 DUF5333 domain-containing protein [Pseudodonghicola flavimaris]
MLRTGLMPLAVAATLLLGLPAQAAEAKPPLREVPEVADGIFTIVLANEIRRKCDGISARLFRGIAEIQRVKARANDLGYSDAEIQAVLDSEDEKARMIARGRAYMAKFGLDYDKPGDLCRLGRLEIKNNSAIGALLRAN